MTDRVLERVTEGVLHECLRVHVAERSLYPEYVRNLSAVKRAIVLCACGCWETHVTARGYRTKAGVLVAALDLECFVEERVNARLN